MKRIILAGLAAMITVACFSQNVGIGTNTPTEKLDVSGNIKTSGEIKPGGIAGSSGQVLTSNGNGTMQWAKAATGNSSSNGGWGDCSIYNIDSFQIGGGNVSGKAVAISGYYAIAGNELDDPGGIADAGSATIFKFNQTTGGWDAVTVLLNANPAADDNFGNSVSISGDYAIVGCAADDEGGLFNCGSATIFKRNAITGAWESQGKMINPGAVTQDGFGTSVSISGDYAVVGSPFDDEGLTNNGTVSVFKRNSATGVWEVQGNKLMTSLPESGDAFGFSVCIDGDKLISGANFDLENGVAGSGSATIFIRNSVTGVWQLAAKLTDPTPAPSGSFGYSVSISGDYVAVGCPQDDFDGLGSAGTVIVFKRNTISGLWQLQAELKDTNPITGERLGYAVSINGEYVMGGLKGDSDNNINFKGSVLTWKRYGTAWYLHQKFSEPNPSPDAKFGSALCISTDKRFIIGAEGKRLVFLGTVK